MQVKHEPFVKGLRKLKYKRTEAELDFLFHCLDINGFGYVQWMAMEFVEEWNPPDWIVAEPMEKAAKDLKRKLLNAFGNYIKAWRQCLDPDSSNKVAGVAAPRLRILR